MLLRISRSDHVIAETRWTGAACTIGSDPDCTLCLPDPSLPERIALITSNGDVMQLSGPLSTIDLYCNGELVTEAVVLAVEDRVLIGDFHLEVAALETAEEHHTEESPPEPEPAATGPRATVERLTKFVSTQLPPGSQIRKIEEGVAIRDGQMASVGEIIQTLSGAELVEGVMDLALQVLLSRFGALRAWVGVRRVNYGPMEYVAGQLSTGQTYELSAWGENLKPRILDRSQFVLIPIIDPKETTSIMAGPMAGTEGLLGMVYLDRDTSRGAYTGADLDFFTIVVSLIGAQVDAILKQLAKNRAAMMAGEVSVAHAIQARLTPRKLAVWPEELQFGAFREPGEAQSNNIYDIVKLGNGMAMFMVAHTPATGWAPCMLISQAQSTFRYAAMHQDAPHVYLKSLNWILCDGQRDHDLCMIVGVIDPGTGQVHYSVAGRTPACIIDTRGEERSLMPAQELPPLGAEKSVNYPHLTEQLDETETLAVFTPGVNAARNTAGEVLGEERLLEILCDGFGQSASALLKDLFNDVTSFIENGKQPEDITVVLAHRL